MDTRQQAPAASQRTPVLSAIQHKMLDTQRSPATRNPSRCESMMPPSPAPAMRPEPVLPKMMFWPVLRRWEEAQRTCFHASPTAHPSVMTVPRVSRVIVLPHHHLYLPAARIDRCLRDWHRPVPVTRTACFPAVPECPPFGRSKPTTGSPRSSAHHGRTVSSRIGQHGFGTVFFGFA